MLQIKFYLPRLPSILSCSGIKSQRLTSFFFFFCLEMNYMVSIGPSCHPPHKCVCTTERISLTLISPGNKTDVLEDNAPVSIAASSAFGLSVF